VRSRVAIALALSVVLAGGVVRAATADPPQLATPPAPVATVEAQTVALHWRAVAFPSGAHDAHVLVLRDGDRAAVLTPGVTTWVDEAVEPRQQHSYRLVAVAQRGAHDITSSPSDAANVTLPDYYVGAATTDITPPYGVNLGGFGLGDGTVIPGQLTSRGGYALPSDPPTERIRARATVVDDGTNAVAIADIETQGMFAAYEAGPYGLHDISVQVAHDIPGLPVEPHCHRERPHPSRSGHDRRVGRRADRLPEAGPRSDRAGDRGRIRGPPVRRPRRG